MDSKILLVSVLLFIGFSFFVSAQSDMQTYIDAAEIFRSKDNFMDSAAMYEKAISLSSGRYDLLREQAQMYEAAKDYKLAMESMNRSLQIQGNHAAPYVQIARYAFELTNDTQVRDSYLKTGIASDVGDPVDAYNKAYAQYFLGDKKGAYETMQNATERFNTTVYLWDWKGLLEETDGNYKEAVRSYEEGINKSPDNSKTEASKSDYLYKKALVLSISGLGTPAEVKNLSEISESLNSGTSNYFIPYIGFSFTLIGDYANASKYFTPDKTVGFGSFGNQQYAEYLYRTGDRTGAEKIWKSIQKFATEKFMDDPRNYPVGVEMLEGSEYGLYRIAMDWHKGEDALKYAGMLVSLKPENSTYREALTSAQKLIDARSY